MFQPNNTNKPATKSYMQDLNDWADRVVIDPLVHVATYGPEEALDESKDQVRKAIREKVLESYRNGQKAGPTQRSESEALCSPLISSWSSFWACAAGTDRTERMVEAEDAAQTL